MSRTETTTTPGGVRIDRVVTDGFITVDGEQIAVDNNVWIVGDDEEAIVIDAAHEAAPIVAAVGERRVVAIAITHAHNDHINVAPELAEALAAPILVSPADQVVWERTFSQAPDGELADGQELVAGPARLRVIATPGHTPGAVCLYLASEGVVFTGDTLFQGGPGATGRPFSDFEQIIDSIRTKLLVLPEQTVVNTGHGDATTIGAEAPHLDEWIARGY